MSSVRIRTFLTLAALIVAPHAFAASPKQQVREEISALLKRAAEHERKEQYAEAIFDYSQALLFKPPPRLAAELYGLRGGVYAQKKQFDRAMADANEAIRLAPDSFRGYEAKARTFMHKSQYGEALEEINHAMRLAPDQASLYGTRGNIREGKGDLRGALADFTKATELDPNLAKAYVGRGMIYYELGRLDDSLDEYHRAIMLVPQSSVAYYDRGLTYGKKNDYAKAISDFTAAIKRSLRDPDAYVARANTYIRQHDYGSATPDFRKALELAPDDPHVLNNLAWLKATCPDVSMRDAKAAIGHARRACELTKWKDTDCIDTLAAAYAEAGNFDQAVTYAQQAMVGFTGKKRSDAETRLEAYRAHHAWRTE